MPTVHSPSAFGEIHEQELHETRLCKCDSLHSCHEFSIHKEREQGEGIHARVRIRCVRW